MLQVEKQYGVIDASSRFLGEFYAENTQRYFCGMHGMY